MELAKVTSKEQITIPIDIRRKLELKDSNRSIICMIIKMTKTNLRRG